MAKGNILYVEDDQSLGFVTQDNLQEAGFNVKWSKDGDEAIHDFGTGQFDLCLLDIMLPKQSGFQVAEQIRSINEFIPIIFLTAKSQEEDRLKGFEIGGDDYVVKPFSIKELIYRIEVFLRRRISESDIRDFFTIGKYSFDQKNLLLTGPEGEFFLTKMEGQLLQMLLAKEENLVKREDILVAIWGENDYFKGRSLDVFISRLRKYLAQDPSIEIKNHHGVGFSLIVNQA